MEVSGNHNYYVGYNGVLVHNKGNDYSGDGGPAHTKYIYREAKKTISLFCGLPVHKAGDGFAFDDDVSYGTKYRQFFTYDPREVATFDDPFVDDGSERGTLSNWWSGCEPVADILNKLIKDGVFYGYPYNNPVAYAFRKDVPTLVFVFTNEYDNAYTRNFSTVSRGAVYLDQQVVWPCIRDTDKMVYMYNRSNDNKLDNQFDPLDPMCVSSLKNATDSTLEEYLNKITVTDSVGSIGACAWLRDMLNPAQ